MNRQLWMNARWIVIPLLAGATLIALFLATGGGGEGSSSSTPAPPPTAAATKPPAPVGRIQAAVTVKITRLARQTWRFNYRIENTGTVPVAGFELTGPQSNLFHIQGRPGWAFYGGGVCGGKPRTILIYWSTGQASRQTLPPKHVAHFKFTVNTSGTTTVQYAVSWGPAAPFFGRIAGPAPSSLPTSGSCSR